MKKLLIVTMAIFCFSSSIEAQLLQTFSGDNYSGINGASLQPASLADSRYRFDVLLGSYQYSLSSNYAAYNPDLLTNLPIKPKHYRESKGPSYYYTNEEYQFLSFMLTLSPKHAIGFTKRTRSITNFDGIDPELALLLTSNLNSSTLNGKAISNDKLSFQQMKYKETAITYARVLIDDNDRVLKVGGTVKLLNGVEAMYIYNENVTITPSSGGDVAFSNSTFSYGYSRVGSDNFNNKLALGFDLGVVYEFRPDHKSFFYDMDGKKGIVRRDLNKYKFKVGASLIDVGQIKYTKTDNSDDFTINNTVSGLQDVNRKKGDAINSFILTNFQKVDSSNTEKSFKMSLPTAFSLQADYYLRYNVYIGYVGYIPIWMKSNKEKVHNIMTNVLSVRYEKKNFGITMPVSIVRNGQVNAGLNVRFQNLTVGATNLSSYFMGKRRIYDVNFYAALRYSLAFKGPADKDGDKVSDKRDECPSDPGPLSLNGCPDSDMDGLPDFKDLCPNDPGPIKLKGCPDFDGDGILDYLDACPTQKGLQINTGCPDTDVDGILDVADRCPLVPGIKENNGCPAIPVLCCADMDGDGILDQFDDCPEIFGLLVNKGCPGDSTSSSQHPVKNKRVDKSQKELDSDSSAIKQGSINADHFKRKVVDLPVPASPKSSVKEGGSGNTTSNDLKKSEGVNAVDIKNESKKENNEIKKENKGGGPVKTDPRILNIKPIAIVYFDKNSFVINPKFYDGLDNVAQMLLEDKDVTLLIQGHTDKDGNSQYNIELSKKRSNAVRTYILTKAKGKIDEQRVEMLYFGENKPVGGNTNEKEMNRRVELRIITQ